MSIKLLVKMTETFILNCSLLRFMFILLLCFFIHVVDVFSVTPRFNVNIDQLSSFKSDRLSYFFLLNDDMKQMISVMLEKPDYLKYFFNINKISSMENELNVYFEFGCLQNNNLLTNAPARRISYIIKALNPSCQNTPNSDIVGFVGLQSTRDDNISSIIIFIRHRKSRFGFAYEAVRTLLTNVANNLTLSKIHWHSFTENVAGCHLALKCGFTLLPETTTSDSNFELTLPYFPQILYL